MNATNKGVGKNFSSNKRNALKCLFMFSLLASLLHKAKEENRLLVGI